MVSLARSLSCSPGTGGCSRSSAGAGTTSSASDVPSTLVAFATAQHATQIVLGTSRRSRWTELTQGSIINRVVREAKGIDVHVIATEDASAAKSGRHRVPIASAHRRERLVSALAVSAVAIVLLGALLARNSALDPRHSGRLTSSAGLLMFLGVVVVVAAIGGRLPALLTAGAALALVDWYLIPPYQSFAIARGSDAAYLAAFMVTAVVAAVAVEQAARRRVEALRSRNEADAVLALADRLVRPNPPQVVVEEIHHTLNRRSVALLVPDGDGWSVEASVGESAITTPADGEHYELRDGHVLVMTGPPLRADEQRLVAALLSYLEAIVAMHRLQGEASTVESLSQANDLRNALLAAVSHDLRTPLASIKALTSGWLEPDVEWSRADTHEFMCSIDTEADRLHKLVENLLDMSRLQSGALDLARRPAGLDEIVPAALASLSEGAHRVVVDVPETLAARRCRPGAPRTSGRERRRQRGPALGSEQPGAGRGRGGGGPRRPARRRPRLRDPALAARARVPTVPAPRRHRERHRRRPRARGREGIRRRGRRRADGRGHSRRRRHDGHRSSYCDRSVYRGVCVMSRILIVDDERPMLRALGAHLAGAWLRGRSRRDR